MQLTAKVLVLAVVAGLACARPHHNAAPVAHHKSNHHVQSAHVYPAAEEEETMNVAYEDTNNLPGVAAKVSWSGVPHEAYDIFVVSGTTYTPVVRDIIAQNHPTGSQSGTQGTKGSSRLSFKLDGTKAKYAVGDKVAVCKRNDAGERDGCEEVAIVDKYDTNDWVDLNTVVGKTFHLPFLRPTGKPYTGGEFEKDCAGAFRGVIHTTESNFYTPDAALYYGHTSAPHFTVTKDGKIYQHISVGSASRALRNDQNVAGETNRRCAIQIETAIKAAEVDKMPADQATALTNLIAWISTKKGIKQESAQFLGANTYKRFDSDTWKSFNGWCGHQHVPENTHWDPGALDPAKVGLTQTFCPAKEGKVHQATSFTKDACTAAPKQSKGPQQ